MEGIALIRSPWRGHGLSVAGSAWSVVSDGQKIGYLVQTPKQWVAFPVWDLRISQAVPSPQSGMLLPIEAWREYVARSRSTNAKIECLNRCYPLLSNPMLTKLPRSIPPNARTPYVAKIAFGTGRAFATFTAEVEPKYQATAIEPGSISGNFKNGRITVDLVESDGSAVRLVWLNASGDFPRVESEVVDPERRNELELAAFAVAKQVRYEIGEAAA